MGNSLTTLFANERPIAEEDDADLGSYATLMASEEYDILEKFPELENVSHHRDQLSEKVSMSPYGSR